MADLNEIVDTLSGLTVMQAAELAKLLEEKWGVSAAAPVAMAAAAGPAAGAAPVEAKGGPLSERILSGSPNSMKAASTTGQTCSPSGRVTACRRMT